MTSEREDLDVVASGGKIYYSGEKREEDRKFSEQLYSDSCRGSWGGNACVGGGSTPGWCKMVTPRAKHTSVPTLLSSLEFKPQYADDGSSGADLFACIQENIEIAPLQRVCIPTGVKVAIPNDCEIQIRPRSGLALKHGITVLNAPGTIDSSYRGEIKVILINLSEVPFTVEPGMKIAQAVCAPVVKMYFDLKSKEDFKEKYSTTRGSGGFGSTGV